MARGRKNASKLRYRQAALVAAASFGLNAWHGAQAANTYTWYNTGTDFGASGDWNPTGPPTTTDAAYFEPYPLGGTPVEPSIGTGANAGTLLLANDPLIGNYTFSGSGGLMIGAGGVIARGFGSTIFNGPILTGAATGNLTFNIGTDAGLTLAGATIASTNAGTISIYGGGLTLDNTGTNTSGRLATSSTIVMNGGSLTLLGNSAGTTANTGTFNVTASTTVPGEGLDTITVNQPVSATGATILNFGNATGNISLRTTTGLSYDFVSTNGQLGTASGPQIKFGAATVYTNNSLISNNSANTVGFAIVSDSTGTNFANYSATTGVVAASTTTATAATSLTSGTTNYIYTDAAGNDSTTTIVGNSFNIQPAAANSGVTLTATGTTASTDALQTQALMLNDSTNNDTFTINASGGFYVGGATKYVYVVNPTTTLATNIQFFDGTNPVDIVGPGFVALTGTVSQVNSAVAANKINLVGGTLRASNTQLGFATVTSGSSQTYGVIGFRGGVLELAGGSDGIGASADFTRSINSTNAQGIVNWYSTTTGDSQGGSGGFSAYGHAASVNIGGAAPPSTLYWGNSTGTGFVQDGESLIFGSTKSNARLDFLNNIALDSGTAGSYAAREIKVIGNSTPGSGDSTNIVGVISGSTSTDLLKTGTGTLTLSGANTYLGNTLIQAGTLQLGNGSTTGSLSSTGGAIVDNGTFTINRSNPVAQGTDFSSAPITGTGAVTVAGPNTGTVTLIAANTYTGVTTINSNGVLQLGDGTTGHDGTILNSSGITDGGTLIYNRLGAQSSGVVISGGGNVVVTGPVGGTGSQTLTGASTYTGLTTINANGVLQLGDGTIGHDGTITSSSGITDGGTLIYNRSAAQSSGVVISGGGNVVVTGPVGGTGSQTLTGASTYTGLTTINANGVLQLGDGTIGHDGTITSSSGITDGGTLIYNRSAAQSSGVVISGGGNVVVTGPVGGTGSQTLTGANTYTGLTTINANGVLQLGDGTIGHDGTITSSSGITDGGTLIYNRSGAQSSGVAISGSGNVVMTGTGSQTLTGANTYGGTTTVSSGSLYLNGNNTGGGNVMVNAGLLGGGGSTSSSVIVAAGATLATGSPAAPISPFSVASANLVGTASTTLGATLAVTLNSVSGSVGTLAVSTSATFGGTAAGQPGATSSTGALLSVIDLGANTALTGTTFTIVTAGSPVTGGFSNLQTINGLPDAISTSNGDVFTVSFNSVASAGSGDVTLDLVATPEPSSLGLLALGGLGLMRRRRRSVAVISGM